MEDVEQEQKISTVESNKKEDGQGYLERKNVKEVIISLSELKLEAANNNRSGSEKYDDDGAEKPLFSTPTHTTRDKRKRKGRRNA